MTPSTVNGGKPVLWITLRSLVAVARGERSEQRVELAHRGRPVVVRQHTLPAGGGQALALVRIVEDARNGSDELVRLACDEQMLAGHRVGAARRVRAGDDGNAHRQRFEDLVLR